MAETQLRGLVAAFTPAQQRLIGATRRALRRLLPTACEVVYEYAGCLVISFSPSEHGYEGVFALRVSATEIRFCFNRGKDLPDPEKLLRGSSQTRWISLEGALTLSHPAIVRLIDEALTRNPVPFARSGRGSVIFRSTAAQRRRSTKAVSVKSGQPHA